MHHLGPDDLQDFIEILRKEGELVEIDVEVNPYLEAAEIHRRVIEHNGPALLFKRIAGSPYPLVTNLFGTEKRIELAFGKRPEKFVEWLARAPHTLVPPTLGNLWRERSELKQLLKIGLSKNGGTPQLVEKPPHLDALPLLTTWIEDGGPFVTLPLVYTEHPETKIHNLGMYRMQRYDGATLGLHCQIGKGGGFHLAAAKARGEKLPVNVSIGGPPALILSAIAPLPENVPELLFASLVLGKKLRLSKNPLGPLPAVSNAEFTIVGEVDPNELRGEGPFGDHYGYYSLKHDYPVFHCKGVLRKKAPIFAATVVGKPKQEDFFIGDYLQKLLSPLFPLAMPSVVDLWSYGETGYHALASAVVRERYSREALVSAFRILGEGQLSLTKFLLLTDKRIDLHDFKGVLEHILERANFNTDLFVFSNTAMDTLDYTGPKVNEGSKGVLLGCGEPIRKLPGDFSKVLPQGVRTAKAFCRGCLVIDGPSYTDEKDFPKSVAQHEAFSEWPLVVLVDSAARACASTSAFLWNVFLRFEPAADIGAKSVQITRNHLAYTPPIVIDARVKPWFPKEVEVDPDTAKLVDKRWREYFPKQ